MEKQKIENKSEKQVYKDYPCRTCGRLRVFISTLQDFVREYVCTNCRCGIGKGEMSEWQDVKSRVERKRGVRFIIGMRLIYPFEVIGR